MSSMYRFRWFACVLIPAGSILAAVAARPAAGGEGEARRFAVVIDSQLSMKSPGQTAATEIDAKTKFSYDLTSKPKSVDVAIHSLAVTAKISGATTLDVRIDRSSYQTVEAGQERKWTFEQAPPEIKTLLESFDRKVVEIELDDSGKETRRRLSVDARSMFVQGGMIENSRLFHAPFPSDKEVWVAPAKFSMGQGQFAEGKLTYRKLSPVVAGKPVKVAVSGELAAEGKVGAATIKNGTYKISGQQVFDPADSEWVNGEWKAAISFDYEVKGQPTGSATGTMAITFAYVPSNAR
jgi:hypothetical protein